MPTDAEWIRSEFEMFMDGLEITENMQEETPEPEFCGEAYIYRYHSPNRPDLYFLGSDNPNDLYLGIELEFDTRTFPHNRRQNKIDVIEKSNRIWGNNTFCYYMRDSSLQYGLEMITQPATYNYHFENYSKYENLFNEIMKHGFKSQSYKNCGFHIHFNKCYFGEVDTEEYERCVSNLLFIAEKFWRDIVLCSRRDYDSLQRWASKFTKDGKTIISDYKKIERDWGYLPHAEKYRAINLINRNTIEFRMHRGTLDVHDFFATLELTKNIIEAAKRFTETELSEMNFSHFIRTSDNLFKYYRKCNRKTALKRLPKELV